MDIDQVYDSLLRQDWTLTDHLREIVRVNKLDGVNPNANLLVLSKIEQAADRIEQLEAH